MFGELVNKISNWVSSTHKTSNLVKKSVPQSIKRNIRSPVNFEIAQRNDFIPVSTFHSKNLQKQKNMNTFLNIRSNMEKNSVINYTTLPGTWKNENSKAKINDPKRCHSVLIPNEPEPPYRSHHWKAKTVFRSEPDSPYSKCTKSSQFQQSNMIGDCSKDFGFRDRTSKFEKSKKKGVYEKDNKSSQISDSGGPWLYSPPLCSHPVESKELIKENLREKNSLSSKSSFKSCEERIEKCHQLAKSRLFCKEKSRDRSLKLKESKKENKGKYSKENTPQILSVGESWIFSAPPSSHPVEFKEFIQENLKQQISLSSKSSFKSSCLGSREKCHQFANSLPISKESSSARDRSLKLEKSRRENKSKYRKENPPLQISGVGESWIFSTPPSSHPVELKELPKENLKEQISLASKPSFKSSCAERKEKYQQFPKSLSTSNERSSARDRSLKLEKSKKKNKSECAKENSSPKILGVGESWIFSTPPSSHPVECKEFIKEKLEQQSCVSSKSGFISSCEESEEKFHQFAKSLPISKESLSSHPVELKEYTKANLNQKNGLLSNFSFKPSYPENKEKCHQLEKTLPISEENARVKDQSLRLKKSKKKDESKYATENPSPKNVGVGESWIFSTPPSSHPVEFKELIKENLKKENALPPVFNYKTLCKSCTNKPDKEVENKESSKPERRPNSCRYESKTPKIDLELGRKLTVHEAIESVPNITTHGSCYCRKPPNESDMLDITKLRPNSSAVKNHISKCPSDAKILIVDDSPENLESEEKKISSLENTMKVKNPKLRKYIPKYKASGDWKKQKYALQLRIYNCTTKYGDPRPLDPCRPILREVGCSQFKLCQK
ncbi:uncharacterized protein LOC117175837 isoform X2 [Belonocnema kinseyi]|uniref:uncharacterized protein LOC117175837 isoform X2 n=1 Tax=Belonocnema kinseyi TaxID=2817044 RepID=UPI00143D82EF|nr:uncharacterized protein LOC117175837 isoform X2 [Belonocnema kinseyi]